MRRSIIFASLVAGCVATVPPVRLAPPETPVLDAARYEAVRARSTRHAHLTHDYDSALDAEVTLATPEFRAAFVGEVTAIRKLPDTDRDRLVEEQRMDAGKWVELYVMMESSRWEWNDLASTKSLWTITFADDTGRSALADDRIALDMKPEMLASLFPQTSPFTRGWKIRFKPAFSDGTPLLHPDARYFVARIAGPLGATEVRWDVADRR